jgi:hypothetical protein
MTEARSVFAGVVLLVLLIAPLAADGQPIRVYRGGSFSREASTPRPSMGYERGSPRSVLARADEAVE